MTETNNTINDKITGIRRMNAMSPFMAKIVETVLNLDEKAAHEFNEFISEYIKNTKVGRYILFKEKMESLDNNKMKKEGKS